MIPKLEKPVGARIPLLIAASWRTIALELAVCVTVLLTGCRAEMASNGEKVTRGTHLVLLESGIHWAEWIKADGSPCGDIYKWNDTWISDTYHEGLQQHSFDTRDEAISYVQRWCQ